MRSLPIPLILIVLLSSFKINCYSQSSGVCFTSTDDQRFQAPLNAKLTAVTSADFNNDGNQDLVGVSAGRISILLGDGVKGFSSASGIDYGYNPASVISADFNEDGNIDIVTAEVEVDILSVLFGDGQGNFPTFIGLETGTSPRSVIQGDFNNDNHADLAVANSESNNVSILLGDGTGNFTDPVFFSVAPNPYAIASGDFNGDGSTDLATANFSSDNTLSVLLGNGSGNFNLSENYTTGINASALSSADFNHDGKSDVAISNSGVNTVTILLAGSNGQFNSSFDIPIASRSIVTADLNGDGHIDLANTGDMETSVLINDGIGNFTKGPSYSLSAIHLLPLDFNHDGIVDLAATYNETSILIGDNTGHFAAVETMPLDFYPKQSIKSDFNKDGNIDLAIVDNENNKVSISLGNGNAGFTSPVKYSAGLNIACLVTADFNNDNKPDIATGNYDSQNISILLGNGMGGFAAPINHPAGSNPIYIMSADFNKDGNADIAFIKAIPNLGTPQPLPIVLLTGDGHGGFSSPVNIDINANFDAFSIADYDGDGYTDLVLSTKENYQVSVYLNDRNGGFHDEIKYWVSQNIYQLLSADMNHDGKMDLIAVSKYSQSGGVSVILNNGNGFDLPINANYSLPFSTSYMATIDDFNGDTHNDLALQGQKLFVFTGDGAGHLDSPNSFSDSSEYDLVTGDFDNNGLTDLALTRGSIIILRNTTAFIKPLGPTIFCTGSSVALQTNANGFSHTWNTGASDSDQLIAVTGGAYQVTISNQNGTCSTTSRSIVIQSPLPAPVLHLTQPTCPTMKGSITIDIQNAGDTYSFDNGINFQTSNTKTDIDAGTHKIIIHNSQGGCNSEFSLAVLDPVIQPAQPIVFAVPAICDTPTGYITVTPQYIGESYSFDNGNTFQSDNTQNGLMSGVYQIVIKSISGCRSSVGSVFVSNNKPGTPLITSHQPTCETNRGSIEVTSTSPDYLYSFDNGETFQTSPTKSNLSGGTYNIKVKNYLECESASALVDIFDEYIVPVLPVVSVSQPTCVISTGQIIISSQNEGEVYSFDNGATFQASMTKSGLIAETYNVIIKSIDGCTSIPLPATITMQPVTPAVPEVTITQPSCLISTGSISIKVQGSNDQYSFDGGTTFQVNHEKTVSSSGTYEVLIKSEGGCHSEIATAIIKPGLTAPLPPNLILTQPSCTIPTGDITVKVQNPGDRYSFDGGESFQTGNNKAGLIHGNYSIITETENGCISVATNAEITEQPLTPSQPIVTVDNTDPAQPVLISGEANEYQWYKENDPIIGATSQQYITTSPGSYSVIVKNAEGCSSESSDAVQLIITGTKDLGSSLVLYPNPVSERLTVKIRGLHEEQEVGLTIISSTGIILEKIVTRNNKDVVININHYAQGEYFIIIQQKNKLAQVAFLKN